MPKHVLLVEDSASTQKIVAATLSEKCQLTCVSTLTEAERELRANVPDLLILDVMLPDGDGFEFCQRLRDHEEFNTLSIIFLTGKTEVDHRVRGLSLGGDDYVTKPLEPKEFLARVEAHLRRRKRAETQTTFLSGSFRVDPAAQKMFMTSEGRERNLDLTPIEFKLMLNFLKNESKTFSRSQLISKIWGSSTHVSEHTVDTHISTLRKKIGPIGQYLKAVVKRGYCFTPPGEK